MQNLASSLKVYEYPSEKFSDACQDWAIYARPRSCKAGDVVDEFKWIMPLKFIYTIHPSRLSSFHALLGTHEIGIFQRQPLRKLQVDKDAGRSSKILSLSLPAREDAVDFALVKFLEILLIFPAFKGSVAAIGVGMALDSNSEAAMPVFRVHIYLTPSPFQEIYLETLYKAFDERLKPQRGNFEKRIDLIPLLKVGDEPNWENVAAESQIDVWMDEKERKKKILTRINGPDGLIVLSMFLNGLKPGVRHCLVLARKKTFESRGYQIRMDHVKFDHLIEICRYNLYGKADGVLQVDLDVSQLSIERGDDFSITATVHILQSSSASNQIDINEDIVEQLQLFKFIQVAYLAFKEFIRRFIPACLNRSIESVNGNSVVIKNINTMLFGEYQDRVRDFRNNPNIISSISEWAFMDRQATMIFRHGGDREIPQTLIVDNLGTLINPQNGILMVSVGLPDTIALTSKTLELLILSVFKFLGTDYFASFRLAQYISGIRIIRSSKTATPIDDEKIPFQVEWIINLKNENMLNDRIAAKAVLGELVDAFVLYFVGNGYIKGIKKVLKSHGMHVSQIFENDSFQKLFQSDSFYLFATEMPFPKFTIIEKFKGKEPVKKAQIDKGNSSISAEAKEQSNVKITNITNCDEKNPISPLSSSQLELANHWDCLITTKSAQFVTSLAALSKLIPASSSKNSSNKSKSIFTSLGFVKSLLTSLKLKPPHSVIFCNTDRFLTSRKKPDGNIVEFALSLKSKDRSSSRLIATIVDDLVKMNDPGILGMRFVVEKIGISSILILVDEKVSQNDDLRKMMNAWEKGTVKQKYNPASWMLADLELISKRESWSQYVLMKNESIPISLRKWSILIDLEGKSIKSYFESPNANLQLFGNYSQIDQVLWFYEDSLLSSKPLDVSFPRLQIQGPVSVVDKILQYNILMLPYRNVAFLGSKLHSNCYLPVLMIASDCQDGKFSSLDFATENTMVSNVDEMKKICEWIRHCWKSIRFNEKWIQAFQFKKSLYQNDSISLMLCFGMPSNRKSLDLIDLLGKEGEGSIENIINSPSQNVLEEGHEYILCKDERFLDLEKQKIEHVPDSYRLLIQWDGVQNSNEKAASNFIDDELYLLRRVFIFSIQRLLLDQTCWARQYIRAIRIVTLGAGQFMMSWELSRSQVFGSVSILKNLKQCLLDFMEMCGALPESKEQISAFNSSDLVSGLTVKLWHFINLDQSKLKLDASNEISVKFLDSPIIKSMTASEKSDDLDTKRNKNGEITEAKDTLSDLQLVQQFEDEPILDNKNALHLMQEELARASEDMMDQFLRGQINSKFQWSFYLNHHFANDDNSRGVKESPVKILHRRKPLIVSASADLLGWTQKLWNIIGQNNSHQLSIVLSGPPKHSSNEAGAIKILRKVVTVEGLSSWQRILLLCISNENSIGKHVNRIEMFRRDSDVEIRIFYYHSDDFAGEGMILRIWQ